MLNLCEILPTVNPFLYQYRSLFECVKGLRSRRSPPKSEGLWWEDVATLESVIWAIKIKSDNLGILP
jgi:hypothetical protein